MIIFESRASIILFNLLKSFDSESVFLLPANVCPIVPATFLKAERKFELIDISMDSLCMDEEKVKKKVRKSPKKYRGVLFVRSYGYIDDNNDFFKQLKEMNEEICIIDDRCLAIPEFKNVETIAEVTLYSTGYSKFADIGYGGYAFINNKIKYNRNNLQYEITDYKKLSDGFKNLKSGIKYIYEDSDWLGDTQSNLDFNIYKKEVIRHVNKMRKHKNKINRIYSENLPDNIQLPKSFQNWRFNILVSEKEKILERIFDRGLFASTHYQSLAGIFDSSKAINANKLHSKVINFFNDFRFNEDKAYQIVDLVKKHIAKY